MLLTAPQATRPVFVREAVLGALRSSGYRPLANLECQERDGQVTLTGVLPSYYLKQLAQTIAMNVEQVREVRNVVKVDAL